MTSSSDYEMILNIYFCQLTLSIQQFSTFHLVTLASFHRRQSYTKQKQMNAEKPYDLLQTDIEQLVFSLFSPQKPIHFVHSFSTQHFRPLASLDLYQTYTKQRPYSLDVPRSMTS